MNWDQQIGQILVMNKSAVSVLLFALVHSRNAKKMVNSVWEQILARRKNRLFLIAQSWDVKLKLMPYLSWFSAQFWKRSKFCFLLALITTSILSDGYIFSFFVILKLCPWFSLLPKPRLRCYQSCTEYIGQWIVLSPVPASTGNKIVSDTLQKG